MKNNRMTVATSIFAMAVTTIMSSETLKAAPLSPTAMGERIARSADIIDVRAAVHRGGAVVGPEAARIAAVRPSSDRTATSRFAAGRPSEVAVDGPDPDGMDGPGAALLRLEQQSAW
jgi:hypothetical protein